MATSQITRAFRGTETLLSKRVFAGNTRPRFHSNFARWSNDAATETRLAFDVTWDGPEQPQNAYQGYSVLVALGKERLNGDLVLLIRPELEDLTLAMVDDESFIDACSKEQIPTGAQVLGRVIAERQFLTDKQLFERAKRFKIAEFAHHRSIQRDRERDQAVVDRIETGFIKAQHELSEAVADVCRAPRHPKDTVFWEMSRAMADSPAYKQLRDAFREREAADRADSQLNQSEELYGDRDVDGPLKDLLSLTFRAGQYAGPEQYMLDPEPRECESIEKLITESLARVAWEEGIEAIGLDTEPAPLNGTDICTILIDLPAYHAERDQFRKSDLEHEHWTPETDNPEDNGEFDFPLRSMLGDWFRAGMLAARTFQRMLPATKGNDSSESEQAEVKAADNPTEEVKQQ